MPKIVYLIYIRDTIFGMTFNQEKILQMIYYAKNCISNIYIRDTIFGMENNQEDFSLV